MAEVNMEQLLNCALCPNMCRCECPVLQVTGREAVAPAGKARISALVNEGKLEWDQEMLKAASNCLACRGCTIHCPFPELNLCDELLYSRLPAREKGVSLPRVDPYLKNLRNYSSPYGQKTGAVIADGRSGKKAGGEEVLFFNGCTSLANHPASIEAARSVLEKAGVSYRMIEEDCCGYPAQTWGDEALARQLAEENRRKFSESGATLLVTNCPECWLTFTERYPDLGQALPLEIMDGPSFFLRLIKEGSLEPVENSAGSSRELQLNVISYHDPCIWARTAEKVSEPREILQAIPGLEIEEAQPSGALTRCCGGGSMFQLAFPETAAAIASRRLQEFPPGAALVTACPFCREGLLGEDRPVWELVELLDRFFK